jgi:ABC-type dipeptide/oligopeptide/nickel transport system permease component
MISYIIRRLLLVIPTLLGITFVVFYVMAMSPGSVTAMLRSAEGDMRAEDRQRIEQYIKERYGLGDPLIVQYGRWLNHISPVGFKPRPHPLNPQDLTGVQDRLNRFLAAGLKMPQAMDRVKKTLGLSRLETDAAGTVQSAHSAGSGFPKSWSFGLKKPDLGESFIRRQPVLDLILAAVPITLLLNLITIPIVYAVSITAGIYAARHRGKWFDTTSGTLFLALYSIPTIWAGVLLLGFFASRDYFPWFPTGGLHTYPGADDMAFLPHLTAGGFQPGYLADLLWHLVLPVVCLTYGGFAFLSKLMRSSVLENLSADFARTARAKGLSENAVLFRHVLSNSLLPLITVAASILPGLLGGSLIVESIFSINGMGRLMLEAIKMKDQELVLSEMCVVGLISLLSLIISDICYAIADPRVSYE